MTKEKTTKACLNVKIINREQQRRAGLNIPADFGIDDILKAVKITDKLTYVLWNDGKPVASETGGTDCIAYLCLKDGLIEGWSI